MRSGTSISINHDNAEANDKATDTTNDDNNGTELHADNNEKASAINVEKAEKENTNIAPEAPNSEINNSRNDHE